jgi:hypothetical protein
VHHACDGVDECGLGGTHPIVFRVVCRYSGSGIFRHVHLTTTPTVRVAMYGVAVSTPRVAPDRSMAVARVAVTVANQVSVCTDVCVWGGGGGGARFLTDGSVHRFPRHRCLRRCSHIARASLNSHVACPLSAPEKCCNTCTKVGFVLTQCTTLSPSPPPSRA